MVVGGRSYCGEFEDVESGVEAFVSDESASWFVMLEPDDGGFADVGLEAAADHVGLVSGERGGGDFLSIEFFGLLEFAAELDEYAGVEDLDSNQKGMALLGWQVMSWYFE